MNYYARFTNRVRVTIFGSLILAALCSTRPVLAAVEDEKNAKKFGITTEAVQQLREFEGLTSQSLERLSVAKLRGLVWGLQHPDLPRQRAKFRLLQEQDENGQIPEDAGRIELQELQQLRKGIERSTVAGIPVGSQVDPRRLFLFGGGIDKSKWTSLGPGNIGGRTRSIVLDPKDPLRFWVGSVGGGVWQTVDAGQHFAPVDDLMSNLTVACMAMDPTDAKKIYAGTGEGIYYWSVPPGAGIFWTTDGVHWQQIKSTDTPDFRYVNRLAISADGKVLLAATSKPGSIGGIFRSDDPARARAPWKKTSEGDFVDVIAHPTDSSKAMAATSDGQVLYSNDAGKTWSPSMHRGSWSGRIELTYCRKNPAIVYASVDNNHGEIWRSEDAGQTFAERASKTPTGELANYLGTQGNYANTIWAGDPENENFVLVGGLNLFKSTDGGDILVDISAWDDVRSVHADHHVIVAGSGFNGTTNKTVFFGNDGGIYKTDDIYIAGVDRDRIAGWKNLNNSYGVTQFYGAAATSSGNIVAGSQDNGTVQFSKEGGSENWTLISEGDGGFCAADPTDAKLLYGEYIFGDVHRTTDGGTTESGFSFISGEYWNGQARCWKPIPYTITDVQNERALFIAPFILDPNNPTRLLVGCSSLWRTSDAKAETDDSKGPTWRAIKAPADQLISAIAVAPGEANIIWVGHEKGDIFKTVQGLVAWPNWTKITASPGVKLPTRYCTRLVIDPRDHQVVFATFGGYRPDNVWRTSNGGSSWAVVGNSRPRGLPRVPVRALAIHPLRSDYLYVGTEIGIFASEDAGKTWSPTNEGPTSCCVDDLFWTGNSLVAVTHGRGVFTIDLSGVPLPH